MKRNIIILDDTKDFQTRHRERLLQNVPDIEERFNVPEISLERFQSDLKLLLGRAKSGNRDRGPTTCFDEAAILFVDYRLIELHIDGFFTGELVAYLARCFSECGLIVALNQFGERVFDLSLAGHPDSFADLNIGANDLENRGLWDNTWPAFRPWQWPLLPVAFDAFERRASILTDLNVSIFQTLGFTAALVRSLPRAVLEFVTRFKKAEEAETITFLDFVRDSGNGLHRNDKTSEDMLCRIAAARISKWLERLVLAGQNTLVDAPHLVARYPSLLTRELSEANLNDSARITEANELPLHHDYLAAHAFHATDWVSRPVWFWESLKDEPRIHEVKDPWSRKEVVFRFCEDSSRFHSPNETVEFVANLPSPFTRRFVSKIPGIDYVPALRFSM